MRHLQKFVGNAKLISLLVQFLVSFLEIIAGAFTQLFDNGFIESFDLNQIFLRNEGHFLHRREPFRYQQMGDHVIHIQRIHEYLRKSVEFLLTAFGFFRLGQDIDIPAGQYGCQPHVLATPSDGKAELVVGYHHFDTMGILVDNHLDHLGRGQGIYHEGRRIGRPRNDVDLFSL